MSRQGTEQNGRWGLPSQLVNRWQRGHRGASERFGTGRVTGAIVSTAARDCQPDRTPVRAARAAAEGRPRPFRRDRRGPYVRRRTTSLLLAAAVTAITASFAMSGEVEIGDLVRRCLATRAAGSLGAVTGRVHDEPVGPSEPTRPRGSVPVMLVPLADAQVAEIEAVRSDARRSMRSYRGTVAGIDAGLERYEAALRASGGTELIRRGATDAEGMFRFDEVPAGAWFLVVRLEVPRQQVSGPRRVPRDPAQRFSGNLEHHGYGVVTYWWRAIQVRAGETRAVELTDRNATLTAVSEDRRPPPGSPAPFLPNR